MINQSFQKQVYETPKPVIGFNHWTPELLVKHRVMTREEWDAAWSFAVVRNPWERTVSLWKNHRKRHRNIGFDDWVSLLIENPTYAAKCMPGISHAYPQVRWTHWDDGTLAVKCIARHEDLQTFWDTVICPRLVIPGKQLPRQNVSATDGKTVEDRYRRDETRRMVEDYYREDIETFGYTFE